MSDRKGIVRTGALALVVASWTPAAAQTSSTDQIGRVAAPEEVARWGLTIGPEGEGLPPGGATAAEGRRTYLQGCARCHGPTGTEGPDDPLVGGIGSLTTETPRKTVGSYWPVATTLWDYINRAMPFDAPGSLSATEVYGTVAYVLFLNDIIGEHDRMDATTLLDVRMPNRDGFVVDPRPDVDGGS